MSIFKRIIKLILVASAVWLFIHAMALFGFFAAAAYPVIWFALAKKPKKRITEQVTDVIFGREKKVERLTATLRYALADSLIMFGVTLVCIFLVLAEAKLFFGISPFDLKPRAISILTPSSGQYLVGQPFGVKIMIETRGLIVNSARSDLEYPTDKLEVVDIKTDGSFAKYIVEKFFDNVEGNLRLSGGLPTPGYSYESGLLGSVIFRPKAKGVATVKYTETSKVLANDGKGTNILRQIGLARFSIKEPGEEPIEVTPPEETEFEVLGAAAERERFLPLRLIKFIDEKIVDFWSAVFL